MYFYWNYRINGFLFENFNIDSLTKCLVILLIVFVMAFLNDGIRHLQKYINKLILLKWDQNLTNGSLNNDLTSNEADESTPLVRSLHIPISSQEIKRRRLINHTIQSVMYVVNMTIGYFLMNIAMCYYAGHFIAIVIGCGFGYYFLHVITPDFYKSISNESINVKQSACECGTEVQASTSGSISNQRGYSYDQI